MADKLGGFELLQHQRAEDMCNILQCTEQRLKKVVLTMLQGQKKEVVSNRSMNWAPQKGSQSTLADVRNQGAQLPGPMIFIHIFEHPSKASAVLNRRLWPAFTRAQVAQLIAHQCLNSREESCPVACYLDMPRVDAPSRRDMRIRQQSGFFYETGLQVAP